VIKKISKVVVVGRGYKNAKNNVLKTKYKRGDRETLGRMTVRETEKTVEWLCNDSVLFQ
jgi:hypothetical protein